MQIYALALEKGGVGKTCLAVNLAATFSRLNLRVLAIDLDAQAHASHWLGVATGSVRPEDSVLGVLNGRSVSDCVRSTDEGVDLLPAHSALASLPVQLATAPSCSEQSYRSARPCATPRDCNRVFSAIVVPTRTKSAICSLISLMS